MKTTERKGNSVLLRAGFCLFLACTLLVSVLALNGIAAGSDAAAWDVKVVSSPSHTAALSKGDLYMWGTNGSGQFPNSQLTYSAEPVKVLSGVADVAVSEERTLVVYNSGLLVSFGKDPTTGTASSTPTTIAKNVSQVAASDFFAAYLTKDGALYTWGRNECGQLGNGSTDPSAKPVQIFDNGVKKVELGNYFGLALKEDGCVYGWGSDQLCELGYMENGVSPEFVSTPVQVMENVQDISAGDSHSCFLKNDGSLWTCGANNYGQTGNGSSSPSAGLSQVLDNVKSVSAGSAHNFAITTDGSVYSWGAGISGQLGNGNLQPQTQPEKEPDFDYVQFFAAHDNTFAISSDGMISSWGENTNYLLGKDVGSNSIAPKKILDADMNWVYLTANSSGHDHGNAEPDDSSSSTPSGGESPVPGETPEEEEPELVSLPFISGNGDGTFKPETPITRAEFLKMVVVALCDYDQAQDYGTSSFSDIPLNRWFENYIAYAELHEIVGGYDDRTFRPDDRITREEATKIAAVAMGLDIEHVEDAGFTDVAGWSVPYINAFAQTGALVGDGDGTFKPQRNITRAEAAKIVAVAAGFQPKESEIKDLVAGVENPFKDVSAAKWYYVYILRAAGLVK